MRESFNGRAAVVTGAASGIGWAVSQALHSLGATVHLMDLNESLVHEREIGLGDRCASYSVDVTDESLVSEVFTSIGAVNLVVHCAGGGGPITPIRSTTLEDWLQITNRNLTSAFLVTKHTLQHMVRGGCIIHIASVNATLPAMGMAAYCAAKSGVAMLTRVAAMECGPHEIRVNAVAPGLVRTPLTARFMSSPVRDDFVENTVLRRLGDPHDVVGAVLFLASAEAAWITGEMLHVDGGAQMMRYPDLLSPDPCAP